MLRSLILQVAEGSGALQPHGRGGKKPPVRTVQDTGTQQGSGGGGQGKSRGKQGGQGLEAGAHPGGQGGHAGGHGLGQRWWEGGGHSVF